VGLEAEHANVADVSAPSHSPERVLLARSELQAVWAAVDFLSPQQREVFLLRFVEELSWPRLPKCLGYEWAASRRSYFAR